MKVNLIIIILILLLTSCRKRVHSNDMTSDKKVYPTRDKNKITVIDYNFEAGIYVVDIDGELYIINKGGGIFLLPKQNNDIE